MISPSPLTNLEEEEKSSAVEFITRTVVSVCSPAHLVSPVSGSTTLRITLCLASYSSLVMGLLVESRAFCASVITAEETQYYTLSVTCIRSYYDKYIHLSAV